MTEQLEQLEQTSQGEQAQLRQKAIEERKAWLLGRIGGLFGKLKPIVLDVLKRKVSIRIEININSSGVFSVKTIQTVSRNGPTVVQSIEHHKDF